MFLTTRAIFWQKLGDLDKFFAISILNQMVNNTTQLDAIFAALADPIRRAIIVHLRRSEASVSELAAPHAVSLPAISKHLRALEEAGLVRRTRAGRVHRVKLVP